jgi:hypothetical protein
VGLVALLPRLYVAIAFPREPVWDGHYYDFGARRIAAGLGYSDGTTRWHPWCHWPVGYSGFLAGVYKVFGTGPHVATLASAAVGTLLAIAVHRLARHWLSPWRARVAGLLCALHPGLIAFSALVMSEPLAALALVVAGWLGVRASDCATNGTVAANRSRTANTLASGLVLGLGTLVRPTLIAQAPFLGWVQWSPRRGGRSLGDRIDLRAIALAAAATAVAFLAVLPWTLRNCRVMDRCAFVSTNGGWNLAIGAFSRATGRFETLRSSDGCAVVTGQVQQDVCWRDFAIAEIEAHPVRWLSLIPKKLGYTFDQESFPVEYLHEADPDRWPEPRRTAGRELLTLAHQLLLTAAAFSIVARQAADVRGRVVQALLGFGLAALSIWLFIGYEKPFWLLAIAALAVAVPLPGAPSRGPVARWIAVSLVATIVTHSVLFGEDRYHVVITPLLCILAAGALRRAAPAPPPPKAAAPRFVAGGSAPAPPG